MVENVFVIGLDYVNQAALTTLPDANRYRFHGLLNREEFSGDRIDVPALLDKAQGQLEAFPGSVDAIVGYWDFPVTLMLPILRDRFGLSGPSLEAVLRCEHKYWSRLVQAEVIDELPAFGVIDIDDANPTLPDGLSYPVWVKPVKSKSSEGAYRVDNEEELRQRIPEVREGIDRIGEPFEWVLSLVDLPPEVAAVGGRGCIVEEASHGQQVTVEGFAVDGDIEVYGTIDSIQFRDLPSFLRYQYPSRLPEDVRAYMERVSRTVISAISLDRSMFNIEYFWDAENERLELLEINPRLSQEHAWLFQLVDGSPHHQGMVDLGVGRRPVAVHGQGRYPVAAKWFLRNFDDGIVRRTPSAIELGELYEDVPGTRVVPLVDVGDRLSEFYGEDSYSYALAHIFTGADDEDELEVKFQRCAERLDFQIAPIPSGAE